MIPTTFPVSETIIREFWLRGNLAYKLHDGQIKLISKFKSVQKQLFVGECSRQFGKSFSFVVVGMALALRYPNARIIYGTAFLKDLIEFILPNFRRALEDCPADIKPDFKIYGSKFVFYNGAEIKLVGIDKNPDGMRGPSLDLVIVDEAGFVDRLDYLYKSVIMPATTHRPHCKIIMISTPPSSPAHDFLDYVQKAELEASYSKFTIYDNPMVNQATIDRLMSESGGVSSTTWRREYMCEHITDSNLSIIQEWDDKYVQNIERDDYYPFYHKYTSMDLGVKHLTAAIFGYYDFVKAKLIIEDEWTMNGPDLTTDIIQKSIYHKEKTLGWHEENPLAWRKVLKRISDNNNPLLIQDLQILHKLHFNMTDKGTLEEMTNTVRMMVQKGQIIVNPKCKQLVGCLKYGVWEKKRDKFAESKVFGHFDALAALVYLVRNLDKRTNPIPSNFQVDISNQILFEKTRESDSVKNMRSAFNIRGRS